MKFRKSFILSVTALVILCATSLSIAHPPSLKPTGHVNDFANIIDASTQAKLEQLLTAYERSSTNEIAVVTVSSLNDVPVEDYATRLFEQWGIGKKDKDNGLLLLVAPNERKARIEVGYGLEGAINDALAGKILDNTVIPWFKKGDYSTGILNGTVESIRIINKRYNIDFDPASAASISTASLRQLKPHKRSVIGTIFRMMGIFILILIFIKNPWAGLLLMAGMSGGGRGSGFRGSSFGGGGFSGFGGGLSGGGGASRGW